MDRRWYIEHADGREWTLPDIQRFVSENPGFGLTCPNEFVINAEGTPMIIDQRFHYFPFVNEPDMVVVWDG